MGYISIALRAIVNLESLNGIETVGNLSRHRTAPLVIPSANGYTIRFLPVVSGESIAHAYQELLVNVAIAENLPLSKRSRQYEFLKFADEKLLEEENVEKPTNENDIRRAEADILLKDFICDVGGFLYAGNYPVKRTSCFQVGYMVPAIYEKEVAALESQFHVRFAPSSMGSQQPYSVEVGSALYTFTFILDIDRIGKPSTPFGNVDKKKEEELSKQRTTRIDAALKALAEFYSYMNFGAKRSRFLPNIESISAVASYSKDSKFTVSPGNSNAFINSTIQRKNSFKDTMSSFNKNLDIDIFVFDKEGALGKVNDSSIKTSDSIEGMIKELIAKAKEK